MHTQSRTSHFNTNLYDKRPVFGAGDQAIPTVVRVAAEHRGVEHGRVAEMGPVASAQQPPCQFRLVHHRGHHVPRAHEGTGPKLVAAVRHSPPPLVPTCYDSTV